MTATIPTAYGVRSLFAGGNSTRKGTERDALRGLGQDVGEGRLAESLLYLRQGSVKTPMQRTETRTVGRQLQGTRFDSADRVHGLDHLEDREVGGLTG